MILSAEYEMEQRRRAQSSDHRLCSDTKMMQDQRGESTIDDHRRESDDIARRVCPTAESRNRWREGLSGRKRGGSI